MKAKENLFKDEFEYEIGGIKIKGRLLNISHFAELAEAFPEWETDSIDDLISIRKYQYRVFMKIIEMGLRGLNKHLEGDNLWRLFNMRVLNTDAIPEIVQLILDIDVTEEAPEKVGTVKNSESPSQTGGTSSP